MTSPLTTERSSSENSIDGEANNTGGQIDEEYEKVEVLCIHPWETEKEVALRNFEVVTPMSEMVVRYPESPTLGTGFHLEIR
jgi:hypothetical protein